MSLLFNHAVENLKPSESIKYIEKAKLMKMQGIDVIGLGGGDPDFPTPKKICDAAYEGMTTKENTHYTLGRGIPALRNRIARKLNEENTIKCTEENILVTPGGKMAIYNSIRAMLNEGDEVLCLDPSWVSYAPIVSSSGGKPVSVELSYDNNYKFNADLLEAVTTEKTKMVIINYPCNPTGRILHEEEALELVKYLKAHENVVILSDEVYEKIIYDGNKHISIGSYGEIADRVITINGFSKCAAMTGWRLGYVCAPKEILKRIASLWEHIMTCTSGFIQDGGLAALDCTKEMGEMQKCYELRRNAFIYALNKIPGISCKYPEGAFYAWVKFNIDGMNSYEICDFLIEEARVVGVPGDAYGLGGDKCLRFSFANSMEDLMEAAKRIEIAMKKLNITDNHLKTGKRSK